MWSRVLIALGVLALAVPALAATDFDELLIGLSELDGLARPVRPGERTIWFTSTDPAGRERPDDRTAWFSEQDEGRYLRVDQGPRGREHVMAEFDGPGAVTRVWMAHPEGTLRIYVDGGEEPVLSAPAEALLSGRTEWCPRPIAAAAAGGYAMHLPVPFSTGVRVTISEPKQRYQVSVRTWGRAHAVVPLSRAYLEASRLSIAKAAQRIAALAGPPDFAPGSVGARGLVRQQSLFLRGTSSRGDAFIADSGRQTEFAEIRAPGGGPGVITDLAFTQFASNDPEAALTRVTVVMTFDGRETVRAPLGALFGCGPLGGEHRGVALGLAKEVRGWVLYTRLPMPFRESARIEIENRSGLDLSARLVWRVQKAPPGDLLTFGAVYREHKAIATRPKSDIDLARLLGKGRIVGATLSVHNPELAWWGDGDPKIRVDGERTPSLWGTGTDDFFGLAAGSEQVFSLPWHAQSARLGNHFGGVSSMARCLVADPVPFETELRFDLGLAHFRETHVDLATVVLWYGDPRTRDETPFPSEATPTWR